MNQTAFDFKRIAQGYKNRPYLHKQVIEQFQNDVTKKRFCNGLDIGCGAGLSTKALKLICDHVVGADISSEMISVAKEVCEQNEDYDFIVSKAEEIPAMKNKVDIVTAAGVIQWVDKDAFLQNLISIMTNDGYVLIYDFSVSDQMRNNDAFSSWWHNTYLKEFPKPFRNESVWTDKDVEQYGFSMIKQIHLEMEYEFDLESFIEFMLIQSNVNDKVEGEGRSIEEVHKWFERTLPPIFMNTKQQLVFTGYSWCFARKIKENI
ncbi:MAG TPA: class I SAM-dependent methyltransferase [Lachnospiraceae bacterium]|nr:class I SAM-dependent methyltransferase [Lachnospiraceae bacterium]